MKGKTREFDADVLGIGVKTMTKAKCVTSEMKDEMVEIGWMPLGAGR